MRNNIGLEKIDNLMSIKEQELGDLHAEKEYLRESMSHPDAFNENALNTEEKVREIGLLHEVRHRYVKKESTNPTSVFNEILEDKFKNIQEKGFDTTEDVKDYTTLKMMNVEIDVPMGESSKEDDKDNDQDDGSTDMDISSSDD